MRFSLASLFVVLFSVANAADVAPNVEACVKGFTDTSNQVDALQNAIVGGGLSDISREYSKLQDTLKGTQGLCCVITTPISDGDADVFLNTYENTSVHVQNLLGLITSKAGDYNWIIRKIIKGHIEDIDQQSKGVNGCLNAFTPAYKAAQLQNDISKIANSFATCEAAF